MKKNIEGFYFRILPNRVFTIQLAVIIFLLIISTIGQLIFLKTGDVPVLDWIIFLFYVDGELTVPAMYSSLIIFACSAMLILVGKLDEIESKHWYLLAAVIGYVACDEILGIHEQAIDPVRNLIGIEEGIFYYAWVIPAVFCLIIFGLLIFKFLTRLDKRTRFGFILSGLIFISGALGLEMLSGLIVGGTLDETASRNTLLVILLTTLEEALEMIGMALFLSTILSHIQRKHPGIFISVSFLENEAQQQ